MELFVPEKFIEARRKTQSLARTEESLDFSAATGEMQQLIRRMYEMPPDLSRAAALSLSDREVRLLAGYLPFNFYELDEGQLFTILRYRMDETAGEALFSQWQESFQNEQCNEFLKSLSGSDRSFQRVLEQNHISPASFQRILDSPNIPMSFDEELVGQHFADGMDFSSKLAYYGVVEQSYLDIECKRALLTFCGRADYLDCSEENILDIIKSYDLYMLRKFLLNFMSKMSLAELQVYPNLAAYLRGVIGHRKSGTFQSFFEGEDEGTIQKFIDWINIFKINLYFDNDERSRFWKQYRYLNVIRYPASDTVILEFDQYIAVEFLGEKKGTIYLCEKENFRDHFYEKLDTMNNEDLRLYFKLHKDLCLEYRNHTGRWQSHIGNMIVKRDMAEKIRI